MASHRSYAERLIKKYQADIASLEEKEEYLTRRIQVMENLIPTIMLWYMWKVSQTSKPGTISQCYSEEEAKKQLLHLENILEELQEADYILKEEEKVMRSRIEELELSISEMDDEPFSRQKYRKENTVSKEHKKIKNLEENKIYFKGLLEDPNTDWPNKCEKLFEKVNELTETVEETNNELKSKDNYINKLEEDSRNKQKGVDDKIKDLEGQNKMFFSEVIAHEKDRDAEEDYINKKVFSAVQEAVEEVETIKKSLTKETPRKEKYQKENKIRFSPQHQAINEEEEEETGTDLLDTESPDSHHSLPEFYQKPLVLSPDEVLPGHQTSSPRPRASFPRLPQIFESLETIKELSVQADSEVKLRTTATSTIISVPPDGFVNLKDLSAVRRHSLTKPEHFSQDFQTSQLEQPVPLNHDATQPERTAPTSSVIEDLHDQQIHPSKDYIDKAKTEIPGPSVLQDPSFTTINKTQAELSHIARISSRKSSDKPKPSSASESEVWAEQRPEAPLAPVAVNSETPEEPEAAIKHPQVSVETRLLVDPTVTSHSSQFNNSSSVSKKLTDAPSPDFNTVFVKSELQPGKETPKSTPAVRSEPIPSTSKTASDTLEALAIMSEPNEASYTDGAQPTSSSLTLEQEAGTLKPRPSVDSLTGQTLQSKCRVKDHLIKNMADHLKDLARKNVWTGNKLFKDISSDPVKTYDFDRTTLYKYIKGQEPPLKSNEPYSSANPLKVTLGRKLDKDSILLEWGPSPSQEVVGFQIFIDGEFKYWVHSAKRSKALLHPVDLATKLDFTVIAVDANGNIVHSSTIPYNP